MLVGENIGKFGIDRSTIAKLFSLKNPIPILHILWRAEFAKVLYSKQSEELNSPMFSSTNVFCYTVCLIYPCK